MDCLAHGPLVRAVSLISSFCTEFTWRYIRDPIKTAVIASMDAMMIIESEKISAWIGSEQAFDAMQKMRIGKLEEGEESVISFSHQAFKQTLMECGDDSVGGFDIMIVYDRDEHNFFYTERLEMFCERAQKVEPGKAVRLSGTAEEGACTLHYYRSAEAVVIDIVQADLTLAYTRGQCTDADLRYKYFLLPMLIRTSTQRML